MYPLTTHSIGSTSVFWTSIERPSSWSRNGRSSAGYCATSALTTWCGTTSFNSSNQKSDICVSSTPLPGIPVGSTTSKALNRSVATTSSLSPSS